MKKTVHFIWTVVAGSLYIGLVLALSGCIFNNSTKDRHLDFIKNSELYVGQNMYASHWKNRNAGPSYIGSKTLPNGNIENKYILHVKAACNFFYEYEPQSGLIVKFRFEESVLYDCRLTGA